MPINESCHILSFRSLRKFIDKLPFTSTCLILSYQKYGKKIKTVTWTPYFNTLTLCFCKEISVFWHVLASRLWNVYCLKHRSFIQMVKYSSFFSQRIDNQSFYGVSLTFKCFCFKKKLCFSMRQQVAFGSVPKILIKKIISPFLFDTINHNMDVQYQRCIL